MSIAGPKGDKGEPGTDGADGNDGQDGAPGAKGYKGEPGADGSSGSVGTNLTNVKTLATHGSSQAYSHSCAIRNHNTLWCWTCILTAANNISAGEVWCVGNNNSGQLGDGTTTSRTIWDKV